MAKASLSQMKRVKAQLDKQESKKAKPKETQQEIKANIPRGERSNFLKLTITMPAELLGELKSLGIRRKAEGEKDTDTSSLVRQAVVDFLQKHG